MSINTTDYAANEEFNKPWNISVNKVKHNQKWISMTCPVWINCFQAYYWWPSIYSYRLYTESKCWKWTNNLDVSFHRIYYTADEISSTKKQQQQPGRSACVSRLCDPSLAEYHSYNYCCNLTYIVTYFSSLKHVCPDNARSYW